MERVTVTWLDAEQHAEHMSTKAALKLKPPQVITVGWLVGENELYITTATDVYPIDGWVNGVNVIPRGMIMDISYD